MKNNLDFDQHFLSSNNILNLETNLADINDSDEILEIGAGDGRLTKKILNKNPKKLISIEIDERFEQNLEEIKQLNSDNFEYYIGNGLDFIKNLKFNKFIANIPYNITEKLYYELLIKRPEKIIILHGINFYNKIINSDSKWHYIINSIYDIMLIKDVPNSAFSPPPKTMSVLLELNLKNYDNLSIKNKLIYLLFLKSERSVSNAILFSLVDLFKISKKEAKEKLKSMNNLNITFSSKLKDLSNQEYVKLINFLLGLDLFKNNSN
jgi:16S rRNA (adenine1518-N6/adenine1519-N6)-dimethyltransferase